MTAVPTARARARAELTAEIMAAASRQVAEHGAAALSLRAVARELGMVSSALYRYFATRDDLLTALIVSAYDALGEVVEAEAAPGPGRTPRTRFTAAARAIRRWCAANPHQHALLFGSPVPGYAASPQVTNAPGGRVPLALLSIIADAHTGEAPAALLPAPLAAQAKEIIDQLDLRVPPGALVAGALAWTSLFGLIGFERSGQLKGTFDPADALFEHALVGLCERLEL